MKLLLVAATRAEIDPLLAATGLQEGENNLNGTLVTVLVTGVGMVATAFALGGLLAAGKYTMALNLGIAGSFNRNIEPGEVVQVTEDRFAELGAEDGAAFITLDELGFGSQLTTGTMPQAVNIHLRTVKAITVNTVHGNEQSIAEVFKRYSPETESMEGAAFFYACSKHALPCLQVRAISNYVERRNRNAWNIGLAVKNLNIFAMDFLKQAGIVQQPGA